MRYLNTLPILVTLWFCLTSCHGEIDVAPDKEIVDKMPKFNFLVRQIDSSGVMDTIKAELYIRQLDYTVEQEKYKLIVKLPENFDGLIHYEGSIYRSGDWIFIQYKDLVDYTTVVNITQRKKIAGMYRLSFECVDSKENVKTESVEITVQ